MRGTGGRSRDGAARMGATMSLLLCLTSCSLGKKQEPCTNTMRPLCWSLPLHPLHPTTRSAHGVVSSWTNRRSLPLAARPNRIPRAFMIMNEFIENEPPREGENIVVDMNFEDIDLSPQFVEDVRRDGHDMIMSAFNPESDPNFDENVELSIVLCSDEWIRDLNKKWRQKDAPTDVLSFPQETDDGILGDLVISIPTAEAQARDLGHDLRHEMRVLMVHGLLHLLGYDHETGEEDKAWLHAHHGDGRGGGQTADAVGLAIYRIDRARRRLGGVRVSGAFYTDFTAVVLCRPTPFLMLSGHLLESWNTQIHALTNATVLSGQV
eukprot:749263-Hanusia_phi.AAC.5